MRDVEAAPPLSESLPANDDAPTARLTERAVRAHVGARNLDRAYTYHVWGAIHAARAQGHTLSARCEGRDGDVWRVCVTLDASGVAAARCSCPVGDDGACKHVGALLLAWIHRRDEFAPAEPLARALDGLDHGALRALVDALLKRDPDLSVVVEAMLPAPLEAPRAAPATWRARAAEVFRATAECVAIARSLEALRDEGLAAARCVGDEVAVHEQLAAAVLGRYRRLGDEAAPVRDVAMRSIRALGECVTRMPDEGDERRAALRTLMGFFRFDIEQGLVHQPQPTPGRAAVREVIARATPAERRRLADRTAEIMERADEWSRRAWAGVKVDLEAGLVDDQTWVALCRLHQRWTSLVVRLLTLGRTVEALEALVHVADGALLDVAPAFEQAGQGDALERHLAARLDRVRDPHREPLRQWMVDRAARRRDALGALEADEAAFRAAPDRAGYERLRERAVALGVDAELDARVHAFLDERAPSLRMELLLADGRLDDALALACADRTRPPGFSEARRAAVDALAEGARPLDAAAALLRQVDAWVAQRSRSAYRHAVDGLVRVTLLYAAADDAARGEAIAAGYRARHAGLRAFAAEYDQSFGGESAEAPARAQA